MGVGHLTFGQKTLIVDESDRFQRHAIAEILPMRPRGQMRHFGRRIGLGVAIIDELFL